MSWLESSLAKVNPRAGRSFIRHNTTKLAALAGWLMLLVSFYGLLRLNGLTLADGVVATSNWLAGSRLNPVTLAASALLIISSITLSRYLRRRETQLS